MTRLARLVWAVEVRYEDENPATYGPYTEPQANRVAARIQEEVELATSRHGSNHHPNGALGAIPTVLTRYEDFLTAEARRVARADAREAERQLARDLEEEGS